MAKANFQDPIKIICQNKKARFNYEIKSTFEAGLVLTGTEVKSLRLGKANLVDSYARIINGEAFLISAHISPYPWAYFNNHEPTRTRKLLLKKIELKRLYGQVKERGLTMIPLKLYFKKGIAKAEIALAVGRKNPDKRQVIKEREANREMGRAIRKALERS